MNARPVQITVTPMHNVVILLETSLVLVIQDTRATELLENVQVNPGVKLARLRR